MANKLVAIDIEIPADELVTSKGTAYYRLDPQMKEFLAKCAKDNTIIGFEYEEDSWNFGVILK